MHRSRRRHISRRSASTRRTARSRASRQRLAQTQAARPRGAAPALKNILSQLTGLASASPWRKQRDKRGAARKPKALRIEGLERREMLTGDGDIMIKHFSVPNFVDTGPTQNFVPATTTPSSPLVFPLFKMLDSPIEGDPLFGDVDVSVRVETDMVYDVDYRLVADDVSFDEEPITGSSAVINSTGSTTFTVHILRSFSPNERKYLTLTLLDGAGYDVPGSPGFDAPTEFELEGLGIGVYSASRTAYFSSGTPDIKSVAPVVDCDCGCLCSGETNSDTNEGAGAAVVKHRLGGVDAASGDASATPNGVLSYNSAALTSPSVRGFDNLPGIALHPPTSIEVTASYYQLNSSDIYEQVPGTSTTSFFTTDYEGARLGQNSGVQYALTPNASGLSTGVYKWKMHVTYHWDEETSIERDQDIEGYQLILNDSASVFGKGWQFSEAPNLTVQNSGKKIVMRSGQNAHAFFYNSENLNEVYDNGVGVSALAKFDGTTTNGFNYTDQYGTNWTYYGNGRIFKSTDRNGNTTQYHYTSGGNPKLDYILYPNGRRTIFEYQGDYVSRIIEGARDDGSGGTSTWLSIENGLLQSITGEDADGDSTGLPAPFTEFNYVGSSALVEQVRRQIVSPLTPSVTNNFEETEYTYYAPSGTVSAVNHTSGSCGCGAATMSFNAAQRWGAADPTLGGSDPQGSATNPAPLRAIGAPQGSKSEQISSTEWRDSTFTIDGFNQISSQTVAPGTAAEATTLYHRNADGLIRRMIEADPDGAGPLSSPITTYNYDTLGKLNLTSINLPNGQSQEWTYGTHNQVTSYTDELGRETRYELDTHGNVKWMQQVIGTPNSFESQGDDVFTQYFYTDAPVSQPPGARLPGGLITKIIDPLNRETKYQYYRNTDSGSAPGAGTVDADRLGLLEKVTFAVSTTDEAEVLFGYDDHRRLTSQTEELTRVTEYQYDEQNRVTKITDPDPDTTDSLAAPFTTFAYDTLGRLARQVDPDPDGASDPRVSHWTEYRYSNNDRTLTVVESPREDGASEIETKYEHDMLGRLLKVTDPLDNVTEYTYTILDQVATVTLPVASSGAPRPFYTYEYDALGRLTRSLAPAPPVNSQPTVGAVIGTSNNLAVTTAAATLELPLYNLQDDSKNLFNDVEDAASTLRYEIVANDKPSLFDSIRIENYTPAGPSQPSYRRVVFDFAGSTADTATITLRATDRGGSYRDREFTVTRTALGAPQLVNTTTSGVQTNAVVANLTDGRYVVVWEGAGSGDTNGVFFKVFAADGSVLVGETLVNDATTTGRQGSPAVAAVGDNFAIVWSDHSASTSQVMFRSVASSGTMGTTRTLYTNSDSADTTPVITVPDGSETTAVAWRATQPDSTSGIFTARVPYAGSTVGTPTLVNTWTAGNQQRPTIAAIQSGGYVIVWDGQGADDSAGIFARRYAANNDPTPEVRLNLNPADALSHSYAVTSDGGVVVTWMANVSPFTAVVARQFAPDGNPTSSEIPVDLYVGQLIPHVTQFDNGDFLVTYRNGITNEVRGRRFRQDGTSYSDPFTIASATSGVARAAARADGSALVVYDGTDSTDTDGGAFVTQVAAIDSSPSAGGPFRILGIEPGSGASGGATQGRIDQVLVNFSDPVDASTLTSPDDIVHFSRWVGTTETAITVTSIVPISRTQIALRFSEQTAAGEYRLVLGPNITRATGAAVKLDQNRNGTAEEAGDKFSGSFYLAAAAATTAAETRYEYDALGRTTKTIDSAGAVTEYAYSQAGQERLITISERLSTAGTVYRETVYRYDALDRLIRVTLPDTLDTSEAPEIEYFYDKASNLLRVIDPRSAKTDYRYDARHRLIRRFDAHHTSGDATNTDLSSALPSNPDSETIYGGVTKYTYNDANELVSVLDTREGLTGYAYDRLGRLTSITQPDPDGGSNPLPTPVTRFKYDYAGYLIQRTDPEFAAADGTISPVTDFEYDTQGNLRFVREAKPRTTSSRPVWEYQYDDAGQLKREIDPLAATTDYDYDGLGQLITITDPLPGDLRGNARAVTHLKYDIRGNLVTQLDTQGNPTQFTYDPAGRLIARTDALGGTAVTQYDGLGRVTAEVDELGRATQYLYTELDQLAELREADPDGPAFSPIGALSGPVTAYHYDATGNLTSVVDPRSLTTTYDYDALGRLIEITQPLDSHGQHPIWQYEYNAAGDLTRAIDPENRVTDFQVDALGRRIKMIAPDPTTLGGSGGPVTEYSYDSSHRLTSVKAPDADGGAGNYNAAITSYQYDNLGRLAKLTLPNATDGSATGGPETTYTRDLLGRVTQVSAPQSLTSNFYYDKLGRVSAASETGQPVRAFWYDELGRLDIAVEYDQWTSFDFDSLGQEVRRTDPRLATTTQAFDAAGQLTSVTDPARNTTSWEYDRLGRVTRETDPKQLDRTYGYDAAGNLTSQTDRLGQTRTFEFDNLNRLTAENWLNSSAAVTRTLSWDYDRSGLLVNTDDRLTSGSVLASAEYDYHYDAAGRLDKSLSTIAGLTKEIHQTHTRNALGRRTALAVDLVTGFDPLDWSVDTTTAEHTNAYTFDHLDQLTRVTQSGGVSGNAGVAAKRVDLEYDSAGRTTKIKRRDGLLDAATIVAETTNTFVSGMVTKIETKNSSATVIAKYEYTNDYLRGRVDKLKTGVGAAEHETTYKYDTAGQLVSADDNVTTPLDENYTWDLNGNRKNLGDTVGTGNQLTTAGSLKYVYDAEGNLLEARTNDANNYLQVAYEWDYRQRLTKVTFKNATGSATTKTAEYKYDGFDRRVSSTVTNYVSGVAQTPTTETYVYDEGAQSRGDVILDFVDSDGAGGNAPAIAKRYLWGQAVDQLFAQEDLTQGLSDSDRFAWLLQDRLNSVREVVNRDGTVAAHIDYKSFGEIKSVTDASGSPTALPTRFTFTGQELDSNTGQYWFSDGSRQGRVMSPGMMRFIQPDPGGFIDGMNLVVYVHNGPTNANDPSGQFGWTNVWGAVKAVGGVAQVVGGVAFGVATAPTWVGPVVGGAVALKGLDNAWAGVQQAWSGEEVDTITNQVVTGITGSETAGDVVDAALDVATLPISGPPSALSKLVPVAVTATSKGASVARAADATVDAVSAAKALNELKTGSALAAAGKTIPGAAAAGGGGGGDPCPPDDSDDPCSDSSSSDRRYATDEALEVGDINPTSKYRAGVTRTPQHHILPREHETWFRDRGVEVDDLVADLDEGTHSALHYGEGGGWWNEQLMKELDNREKLLGRTLTPDEIYQSGRDMMERAGLADLEGHPYERS